MSRREKNPDPEDFKIRLKGVLEAETDRGLALVGAAYLDSAIEKLLRAFFVADPQMVNELIDPAKPLSTFSSRCSAAYCLGFIGPQMYKDLNHIRKIRNLFAHEYFDLTFDSTKIKNRCQDLRVPDLSDPEKQKQPRERFILSVTLIAYRCLELANKTTHQEAGKDYRTISSNRLTFTVGPEGKMKARIDSDVESDEQTT